MPKLALAPLFVCAALCFAGQASAATFTVDDDAGNAINSSSTTCDSPCSLYQAITSSNDTPGTKDTIQFSTHHITLTTPLPGITDPVNIDGGTSSGKPATVLSGATGVGGFILEAPNSTIENLVLNHFDGPAVAIIDGPNAHPDSDLIAGDYIGTNASGTSCSDGSNTGNGEGGIVIAHGTGHQVGGFDASERNVIACNTGAGVTVGASDSEAGIYNNYIGLLANGNSGSGQTTGVSVSGEDSTIGTPHAGGGNVISGNTQDGVDVTDPNATGLQIDANYIGTDPTATAARGNGRYGISETGVGSEVAQNVIAANGSDGLHVSHSDLLQVTDNNIGRGLPAGGAPGVANGGQTGPALGNGGNGMHGVGDVEVLTATGNVIASNSRAGVAFDQPANGNLVQQDDVANNYFSSNGALGIDMNNDGVTSSPTTDSSDFADLGQQLPVLTAVDTSGGHTTVQGTYHSKPNREYTIYFYPVATCDPSGYGEGEATDFHPIVFQTNGSGDASFNTQLSQAIPPGSYVTATAVDVIDHDTSEFSRCLRVPGLTVVSTDPATGLGLNGATINGSVNPDGVATHAHFEWGTTTAYGASTPDQSVGSDSTTHAISVPLSGLAQGTTFHYRVVATNSDGRTTTGPDKTFTTASPPAPPAQPQPQQRKRAQCVVPKLRGKNLATIKKSLRKAHCKLGKVTRRHRHGKKKGRALGQSLRPGKHKPAGTKVNVVLEK
jgi:PASTA domain-containing protein